MRKSIFSQLFALAALPLYGLSEGSGKGAEQAADLASRAIDKAKKDVTGRKDKGQEGIPDEKKLKEALPGVAKILKAKLDGDDAYSKKVKAAAKASGFLAVVVRAAAKAFIAEPETREEETRKAEQMELALEVVGKMKK